MPEKACPNCKSKLYHRLQGRMDRDGLITYWCSDCTRIPLTPMYDDVYLGPGKGIKYDENICDPKTGREIPFITKQDKYIAMKMAGIKQASSAERQHGSRNEMFLERKKYFEVR